jgi:phosphatidylinositol 3-kinase
MGLSRTKETSPLRWHNIQYLQSLRQVSPEDNAIPDFRTLRTGHQKLKLWLRREADGLSDTTTPGTFTSTSEMDRLEKLVKRHEQGDLPRLDWLDNLAFRKIERLHTSIKSNGQVSDEVFIYIDFPRFDFPVIYSEPDYPPPLSNLHLSTPSILTKGVVDEGEGGPVCLVWDPESIRDNPVESKHRRLVRSHRNGPLDRDLKPNPKIRDELNVFPQLLMKEKL